MVILMFSPAGFQTELGPTGDLKDPPISLIGAINTLKPSSAFVNKSLIGTVNK